jgi:2-polyprenyl-3-methyl-5-hydroxy-6-metoxy-1,4-benzoquinol methylase
MLALPPIFAADVMPAQNVSRFWVALLLVCGCTAANLLIRWIRWQFLARHLGVRLQSRISITVFSVSLLGLLTPFGIGEVGIGYFLRSRTRHPWVIATALWLVCRFGDVVALAALMLFSQHRWFLLVGAVALALTSVLATRFNPEHRMLSRDSLTFAAMYAWTSIAAWLFPTLALFVAGKTLMVPVAFSQAVGVFTSATLRGGWVPGGFYVASAWMSEALARIDGPVAETADVVHVLRLGTVGFALLLATCSAIWKRALLRMLLFRDGAKTQQHFDDLARDYANEIPSHVRDLLLDRKVNLICRALERQRVGTGAVGLDLGCGQGSYAIELARRGFRVSGVDPSVAQIQTARENVRKAGLQLDLRTGTLIEQRFPDATFDFIYSINVLHHITSKEDREATLDEVARILRPGGVFILQEINVSNPLNRLYMSYIFPLINRIDDGSELWLLPTRLPEVTAGSWAEELEYFTFIPDFLPKRLLGLAERIEPLLSKTFLRSWSAHYMAVFEKNRLGA